MRLLTRNNLLGVLFGLLAVVLGYWGRYKSWFWYDNLAHLSAGLSLGAFASSKNSKPEQDVLIVLAINIMWELHEYQADIYPWDESVPKEVAAEDTILDTLLVIGAAYYASKASKPR